MKQFVLGAVLALSLGLPSLGQTLAHSAPASTLVYVRQTDPIAGFQKFLGSSLFWASPIDLQKDVLSQMDEALGQVDGMLGIEVGSIGGYLRSVKVFEGVLYSLQLTDAFPEIEFAVSIETPQAEAIYKLLSGKLIEEQIAEQSGPEDLNVSIGDAFGIAIARRGDRVIIANDQRRLNETVKGFGSSSADSLAKSKEFQNAIGGDSVPDIVAFSRIAPFLDMAMQEGPRFLRREQGPLAVARALGIFKLAGAGYVETDKYSRFGITANEDVLLMDVFATQGGSPEILADMPIDSVFSAVYGAEMATCWKKASSVILDPKKFPFAEAVERGIAEFQQQAGVKVEELAAIATRGIGFAYVPRADGQLDDDPENFIFVLPFSDRAKAMELGSKLMGLAAARMQRELETKEDGEVTYYSSSTESKREQPSLAFTKDRAIFSAATNIRRLLEIQRGKVPGLGSAGVLKGLKPGAAGYGYVGLKSIFAQEREFGPAHAQMKDSAGIAFTYEITPQSFTLTTNAPLSEIAAGFATATSMYEAQEAQRSAALRDLEKIGKAWREYRGAQQKNPNSLSDLGFVGDKALVFPPNPAVGVTTKPYVLTNPPSPTDELRESEIVIAYAPDGSLGRLAVMMDGSTRTTSEVRFQAWLRNQAGK